ncbi:MAG: hypothetical protein Q7J65_08015 [Candidatus Marinimicrobia bacterium]|nr:hypothetical protein [Candidatus Neomarinimicrobiota bacterium]
MCDSNRFVDRVQLVSENDELSFREKLMMITNELSTYFDSEIYFCEIKGKRWSYVAGSADTVYGSIRFPLTNKWGIILDHELVQDSDSQLIFNMIRGILTD